MVPKTYKRLYNNILTMNILNIYEGALYYFDKAIEHIKSEEFDEAMKSLTKGYKHLQGTPVNTETKAKFYTDMSVKEIQNKHFGRAEHNLHELRNIIENWLTCEVIEVN